MEEAYRARPELFNALIREIVDKEYHPTSWRSAQVVIIRKPNKPDYTAPKANRPISLRKCISKVAERVVANKVANASDKFN